MIKRELKPPRGYNPRTQAKIGLFAAQLDDQLKRLKATVEGLSVKQLEWQKRRGMNTIGMLLAHIAVAELWWINVAAKGLPWKPDGEKAILKVCGFEDDGIPLKPNEKHTKYLKGYSLEKYLGVLAKVRRGAHKEMKTWYDRDLDKPFVLHKRQFTKAWILYHVLEHLAAHFGQILMIKHMMRDAGVLKEKK